MDDPHEPARTEEQRRESTTNTSANTRLAQGYHDSYFLKECHDIR